MQSTSLVWWRGSILGRREVEAVMTRVVAFECECLGAFQHEMEVAESIFRYAVFLRQGS